MVSSYVSSKLLAPHSIYKTAASESKSWLHSPKTSSKKQPISIIFVTIIIQDLVSMESIASLKSAAARAIWGDEKSHQEPISGKTGDVSKGEPYDAGNMGGRRPTADVVVT